MHFRSPRIRIALTSLVLACTASAAFSQDHIIYNKVSLHGVVRDSHGQPVAGATIRLEFRLASDPPATAVSDTSGQFFFAELDPMAFNHVSAEAKGFKPTHIDYSLTPGRANEISITLAPADASPSSNKQTPQFYDEPKFTVSGVTDTTALGGHGSDTVVRTRDSLARETAALTSEAPTSPATRAALEAERDRAQFLIAKDPDKAEPHHRLADAEEQLGDALAAVREYQRAAELNPSEPYVFDWGSELLLHHAPEPALEVFTKGNHQFPKSERMLLGLGSSCFALGSLEAALEKFRDAANLPTHNAEPYDFVGKIEMAEKVPSPAAMGMLHRFVTEFPENFYANYYYATVLWRSRDTSHNAVLAAQVEALLRKASEADPHLPSAHLELGIVHADMHEYEKAIPEYQQAIELASELESLVPGYQLDTLAQAHFRLAEAYRDIGNRNRSAAELTAFKEFDQKSAQQADRERHEIPQFLYTLRDKPAAK